MATLYLDFENGNDTNDCLSFANRGKTINSGATAARTAPGDTIRLMKSPDPTSLGQTGVWTSGRRPVTVAISSSTNATPIVITTSSGHGYSNGDTVTIQDHGTNTKANGVWEIANVTSTTFELVGSTGNGAGTGGSARKRNVSRVKLTTAVTANIASYGNTGEGRTAWTAAANVTCSLSTTTSYLRFFDVVDQFTIADGHTTGLVAYKATGTLDLSGYQQVSFRIFQSSGTTITSGKFSIRLCSDTAGTTTVDTLNIPGLGVAGYYTTITIDKGSALGNAIQSIAIYADSDNGATTFFLDNIIACKATSAADSLTNNSLIGKSGGPWWNIACIYGTRVLIADNIQAAYYSHNNWMSYYGTSETVTTYKRECITPDMVGATTWASTQEAGGEGNLITYSGGWDTTNMSTQTGETWIDFRNHQPTGISLSSYVKFEKVGIVRAGNGFILNNTGSELVDCSTVGCNSYGILVTGAKGKIGVKQCIATGTYGLYLAGTYQQHSSLLAVYASGYYGALLQISGTIDTIDVACCGSYGIYLNEGGLTINTATVTGCVNGLYLVNGCRHIIKACTSINNDNYGVANNNSLPLFHSLTTSGNSAALYNYLGSPILLSSSFAEGSVITSPYYGGLVYSQNHNGTGVQKVFGSGFTWGTNTSVRHTASGWSWDVAVTSTDIDQYFPAWLPIATIAVNANALVTVKAWMRRTNTGLTLKLVCKGGQIAGVTNDVSTSMTAAADTWEEVTITFTPTVAGVVEITAEAYGGTTYTGYVDDLTISQA